MRQEPNRSGELAVFVAVVQSGAFAGAAVQLGMTPSAISKSISRLEARLGITLLKRSTRRLALTDEGQRLFDRAVSILAEIEDAEREASSRAAPTGRIRINSSASYVVHRLAPILPEFLRQYPQISLDIIQSDAVADLLVDGSDVAIRAGVLADSALVARSLGKTSFVFVAAPSWIEGNGRPSSPANLATTDLVNLSYRSPAHGRRGTGQSARVQISDGEGVRQLVLAGAGPARMAEFTVRADVAAGRLLTLFKDPDPGSIEPFHAVYVGPSVKLPARVRVLLDFLTRNARVD